MSGATAVAVVAAKTSTGNQNITTTDLGGLTPKAVVFLYSHSPADGSVVANSARSTGATDGTNQIAHCWIGGDASLVASKASSTARHDCCLMQLALDEAVHSQASVVGFIANGVTVNWTTASTDAYLITALFFAGDDWTAQVGTSGMALIPSQSAKTTLGWQPDCVMCFNAGAYLTNNTIYSGASVAIRHSMGWAVFNDPSGVGMLTQYTYSNYLAGVIFEGACGAYPDVANRYNLFCGQLSDGFFLNATLIPGGGHTWGYLALKYTGTGSLTTGTFDITKDTAGDYAVTGFGGQVSQFLVLCEQEQSATVNSQWSQGTTFTSPTKTGGGAIAGGTLDRYSRPTTPWYQDAVACNDTITLLENYSLAAYGTVNFVGTVKSFDADGITLNFTTPPVFRPTVTYAWSKWTWGYLTLLGGATPPPPPPPPPVPVPHTTSVKGDLIGATYRRKTAFITEEPAFVGWHRHDLGHARKVASIASGSTKAGLLDRLNMVTTDGTAYFNESLTPIFDEDDSYLDAWFVDGGRVPDSVYEETNGGYTAWSGATHYVVGDYVNVGSLSYQAIAASLNIQPGVTTGWATYWRAVTGLRLTGLFWMRTKTVAVYIIGLDVGDFTVDSDGTIFVPYGTGTAPSGVIDYAAPGAGGYLFTSALVAATVAANITPKNGGAVYTVGSGGTPPVVIPCVVGFPFTSDGQLLRPIAPDASGAKEGPAFGKLRRQHRLAMLLQNSLGLQVGTDFTTMYQAVLKQYENGPQLDPQHPFSGMWRDHVWNEYDMNSMLSWRIVRPYPSSVVAIGGHIETQDI